MRITYRYHEGNKAYWKHRWDNVEIDSGDLNLDRYPGKYAEQALSKEMPEGPILEAGCGTGRVLLYYHASGKPIIGMDFIESALSAIRSVNRSVPLTVGDICSLPFGNGTFSAVLAFGLFHNLETGLDKAVSDTRRVMKKGGVLCASMRLDNLQNYITDRFSQRGAIKGGKKSFHKLNLSQKEILEVFQASGFKVEQIDYVENMPFLYKIRFLRHKTQRVFDEKKARAEGYRLSWLGSMIQNILMKTRPDQFSNVAVVSARAV